MKNFFAAAIIAAALPLSVGDRAHAQGQAPTPSPPRAAQSWGERVQERPSLLFGPGRPRPRGTEEQGGLRPPCEWRPREAPWVIFHCCSKKSLVS